jgi:hypothetical protein
VDLTPGVPDTASLRATDYDAAGPNGEFRILAPDATEAGMAALESRLMMLRYQASRHMLGNANVHLR